MTAGTASRTSTAAGAAGASVSTAERMSTAAAGAPAQGGSGLQNVERLDFHLHTYYSACGKRDMIPATVATEFRDAGYTAIGFTDHLHPWIDPVIYDRLRADLAASADGHAGLTCYVGCEAEVVAPGLVTLSARAAEKVDFAIVSASHFQLAHVARPGDPSPKGVAAHYLSFFWEAIRWPGTSVIAHPFHTNHDPFGPMADIWRHMDRTGLRDALQEAAGRGVAMELSPKALSESYYDLLLDFYCLARECGTRFTVGSDAHARSGVASTGRLRTLAEAIGLSDTDLWRPTSTPIAVR
jgi:histidinol phosphatase-like PHP family hydrolase